MKGIVNGYKLVRITDARGDGFYIDFLVDGNSYLQSQVYYPKNNEIIKRVKEKLDDYIYKTQEAGISRSALDWPTMLRFTEDTIFYDE